MSDDESTIYITAAPDPGGVYRPVIELSDDVAVPMSQQEAVDWARALARAAACAEYDAALFKQLTSLGGDSALSTPMAAEMIHDFRMIRKLPSSYKIHELEVFPEVSAFDSKPYLRIMGPDGAAHLGRWSPQEARRHAAGLLEIVEVCRLDTALMRWLTGSGLPAEKVGQMIAALNSYRQADD